MPPLLAALRPSERVARYTAHVRQGMDAFARRKKLAPSYVSLQLPSGEDWTEYCRQQQLSQQAIVRLHHARLPDCAIAHC